MKCYNHLSSDAVSICDDCPKGLCRKCVDRYSKIIVCDSCNLQRAALERSASIKGLIRLALTLAIGTMAGYQLMSERIPVEPNIFSYALCIGYLCVSLLAGWRVVSTTGPGFTMLISLPIWVAYMAIKAVLSVFIGFFVVPYRVISYIVTIVKVANLHKAYADIDKQQALQSIHTGRLDSLVMDANSFQRSN